RLIVRLRRAFEPSAEGAVRSGRDLLPVSEILELPLRWGEVDVILLPDRGPHGMNEDAIAVRDRCNDAGCDVVLRCKDSRRLQVPIIGLGPELRSCLGVGELGAHANAGASLADASFQHVTRAEFGAQGPLVSNLSLQSRGQGARNDREIWKRGK